MKIKLLGIFLLSTLFYSAFSQNSYRNLTVPQMQADLNILQASWTSLHPGLYKYNTPGQIKAYFDSLQIKCTQPLNERAFYILLSQLAQKIRCGHTYLNPLNLSKATQKRLLPANIFPCFFEVVEGSKIIVTHNVSNIEQIEKGDQIVAINGISSKRIIDSLLTVSRSDGNHSIAKKLSNINESIDEANAHSLFDIYFPMFFPSKSSTFTVTVKKFSSSSNTEYVVKSTTLEDRIAVYEKRYGKIQVGKETWDYKLIDRETAYMKFGTFAFWNSNFNEKKFVDSVFYDVAKHGNIKNLIIDIRNNEGGDNTGNYILSFITEKRIGCDDPDRRCYRYLSIPDTLLPYLQTWDNTFKKSKDPNKFFKNELGLYELKGSGEDCVLIQPAANVFKGKKFLLTNAKNSSAGYEMARNFKTANLGKIIGETTGGSQQGINGGEFFFLTLPNSGFEIDLPLVYNYHQNKPDHGIIPDYEIKTTQKDIHEQKDTQLGLVLAMIAKGE